MITIVATATLASIGTAGVPGAGMVMLAMVLQSVGLPIDGIALVAGVDRIFDMGRTTVNITGDATVGRKQGHTGCSETQGTTIGHGHFRVRCPVLCMSEARTLPCTWAVPQAWVRRCASSSLPASAAHLRSGHTQPTPRLPSSSPHSAPSLKSDNHSSLKRSLRVHCSLSLFCLWHAEPS